jgi:hypothetical protein
VHAKCLAKYGIKHRKGLEFFVGWQAKGAIGVGEILDLFLIELLADNAPSKTQCETEHDSNSRNVWIIS